MVRFNSRGLRALVVTLILAFVSTSASADDLTGVLGQLNWGDTPETVIGHLQGKIDKELKKKIKEEQPDTAKLDRMRKRYNKRKKAIEDSLVPLVDGTKSGLEVSIVSNEFAKNNNEKVLVVHEDISIRYFFFLNDRLYKVAVSYDADYIDGLAYDSFVYAVSQKYGKPKKEITDEDGFLVQSIWEQGDTRLRLNDTFDIYSTHLMVFTNIADDNTVASIHEAKAEKRSAGPDIDDDIAALEMDDDEDGEGSAADSILGDEGKVDLMSGLPQEDIDAIKAQQYEAEEGGGAKVAKREKKKKKKKRRKKSKKFKEKELEDRQKKLIIY